MVIVSYQGIRWVLYPFLLMTLAMNSSYGAIDESQWPWLPVNSETKHSPAANVLYFKYLGTGGVYLALGENAVLADPFFSNPSLSDLLFFKKLKVNKTVIKKYLPQTQYIKGILVGHGHYDHLMDVPFIATLLNDTAKIVGNETAVNQVAAAIKKHQLINVLPNKVNHASTTDIPWIYLSDQLRIMALESQHPPHVAGFIFASDQVKHPQAKLPENALDWQSGKSIAYVIEWLKANNSIYRVLYLSSAAGYPHGLPPHQYLKNQPGFDLALLGIAKFQSVEDYPAKLLKIIRPKAIVMLHWEKFWQPYIPGQEEALDKTEVAAFIELVQQVVPASKLYLPRRQSTLTLPIEEP